MTQIRIFDEEYDTTQKQLTIYNKIIDLNPSIWQMTQLSELILVNCNINTIPKEIGELTQLEILCLKSNRIQTLPIEICKLVRLARLDLSENLFSIFPVEICELQQLTYLKLSHNSITCIPPAINMLPLLNTLILTWTNIVILPIELTHITELTYLDLGNTRITYIPKEICNLTKLNELDISRRVGSMGGREFKFKFFETVPIGICSNSNITILKLDGHLITDMVELCQLVGLRELDVSNNMINTIPPEIGNLVELRKLDISCNCDRMHWRDRMGEYDFYEKMHQLSKNKQLPNIMVIPPEIGKLVKLKTLDIAHNFITTLPHEICYLTNLQTLNATNTLIRYIQPEIFILKITSNLCYRDNFSGYIVLE